MVKKSRFWTEKKKKRGKKSTRHGALIKTRAFRAGTGRPKPALGPLWCAATASHTATMRRPVDQPYARTGQHSAAYARKTRHGTFKQERKLVFMWKFLSGRRFSALQASFLKNFRGLKCVSMNIKIGVGAGGCVGVRARRTGFKHSLAGEGFQNH